MRRSVNDIKLGALYRFGIAHRLSCGAVAILLASRCGLSHVKAEQLAAHWFKSEPYRENNPRAHEPAAA